MTRTRILVLAEEKGLAETLWRGLRAMSDLDPEVEVTMSPGRVTTETSDRLYDLVVVGAHAEGASPSELLVGVPDDLPCVVVSEKRNGTVGAVHVPLPLSYNLLRSAVLDALDGKGLAGPDEVDRRVRDLG